MLVVISWIVWTLAAVFAVAQLIIAIRPRKQYGERFETADRWLMAMPLLPMIAGLVATATLPISQLHLLWFMPLAATTPYMVITYRTNKEVDDGTNVEAHRPTLEARYGQLWTAPEFKRLYSIIEVVSSAEFAAGMEQWARIQSNAPLSEADSVWSTRRGERVIDEVIRRSNDELIMIRDGFRNVVGMVFVRRRADGAKGTLLFVDLPRFYFSPSESLGGDKSDDEQ